MNYSSNATSLVHFYLRHPLIQTQNIRKKHKRLTELDNILEKAHLRQSLEGQLSEAKELSNGNDELAEMAKQ
jgi:hypothetical protein